MHNGPAPLADEQRDALVELRRKYNLMGEPMLSWTNLQRYRDYFQLVYPETPCPGVEQVAEAAARIARELNQQFGDGPVAHFAKSEVIRMAGTLLGVDSHDFKRATSLS